MKPLTLPTPVNPQGHPLIPLQFFPRPRSRIPSLVGVFIADTDLQLCPFPLRFGFL